MLCRVAMIRPMLNALYAVNTIGGISKNLISARTAVREWKTILMGKKSKKKEKKAYLKGRKDGFDHGFNTAKMILSHIAVDLKRQVEQLNSEIILGEEGDEE